MSKNNTSAQKDGLLSVLTENQSLEIVESPRFVTAAGMEHVPVIPYVQTVVPCVPKNTLKYKKLTKTAIAPEKAHASDAGFDLFSDMKITINGPGLQVVSTGISLEIPEGYFGKIFDRSGISVKTDLIVKAGVIDADYRGEVKIVLANMGHAPNKLPKGTKIAQLVLLPVPVMELEEISDMTETERGDGGFGSTDKP